MANNIEGCLDYAVEQYMDEIQKVLEDWLYECEENDSFQDLDFGRVESSEYIDQVFSDNTYGEIIDHYNILEGDIKQETYDSVSDDFYGRLDDCGFGGNSYSGKELLSETENIKDMMDRFNISYDEDKMKEWEEKEIINGI